MSIIRPCMRASSLRNVVYPSAMNVKDAVALFELPFPELIYRAQSVHRSHHDPAALQLSSLLSVKTGGCPEDCAYCPQSRRYRTGVEDEDVLSLETVTRAARALARGLPARVLGRHRRHRRVALRPRRLGRLAGGPRSRPGERADQRSGRRGRHTARAG